MAKSPDNDGLRTAALSQLLPAPRLAIPMPAKPASAPQPVTMVTPVGIREVNPSLAYPEKGGMPER